MFEVRLSSGKVVRVKAKSAPEAQAKVGGVSVTRSNDESLSATIARLREELRKAKAAGQQAVAEHLTKRIRAGEEDLRRELSHQYA